MKKSVCCKTKHSFKPNLYLSCRFHIGLTNIFRNKMSLIFCLETYSPHAAQEKKKIR